MPPCSVGNKCVCPTAPLDGRHLCAICKKDLHGPCGVFNGDDGAITNRNRCFSYTATDSASESDESTLGTKVPFVVSKMPYVVGFFLDNIGYHAI